MVASLASRGRPASAATAIAARTLRAAALWTHQGVLVATLAGCGALLEPRRHHGDDFHVGLQLFVVDDLGERTVADSEPESDRFQLLVDEEPGHAASLDDGQWTEEGVDRRGAGRQRAGLRLCVRSASPIGRGLRAAVLTTAMPLAAAWRRSRGLPFTRCAPRSVPAARASCSSTSLPAPALTFFRASCSDRSRGRHRSHGRRPHQTRPAALESPPPRASGALFLACAPA